MLDQIRNYATIRARLRNPSNAVWDSGIDLKRKATVVPIIERGGAEPVPVVRELNLLEDGCLENLIDMLVPQDGGPIIVYRTTPKVPDIIFTVAKFYNVDPRDILSSRRTRDISRIRQIACYLARTLTPLSYPRIGRDIGYRDHTSIIHAVGVIERMLPGDERLRDEISLLKIKLTEFVQSTYVDRGVEEEPPPPVNDYVSRKPHIWTPERVAVVKQCLADGVPRTKIAELLGTSLDAIHNAVRRLKLAKRI